MIHDKAITVAGILAFAITAALFGRFPGAIPLHWGDSGKPDLWAPTFLLFCIPLGMLLANYTFMNERAVDIEARTKKARYVAGALLVALALVQWWILAKLAKYAN